MNWLEITASVPTNWRVLFKMSNEKGDRAERELVRTLDEIGWGILRIPASGGGTDRDLPDVLAGRPWDGCHSNKLVSDAYAFEAKASSGDPIYIDREEITGLRAFAAAFGATPRLAVKFDVEYGDPAWGHDDLGGIYAVEIGRCHVTDGGNYRVKKPTALDGVVVERL